MKRLNKETKKNLIVFVLLVVLQFTLIEVFMHCFLKMPDAFGIQRKKEYNELKNDPPDDLCQLDLGYDGYSQLPASFVVGGRKLIKMYPGQPWHVSRDNGRYIGQMLITYKKSWSIEKGFGYNYSSVYSFENEAGEIICLLFDDGTFYLDSTVSTDLPTVRLTTSSELFSDVQKPFLLSDFTDSTYTLAQRQLRRNTKYYKGASEITEDPDSVYYLSSFIYEAKYSSWFFSEDYPFLEWHPTFYLYRQKYYIDYDLTHSDAAKTVSQAVSFCVSISDPSVISKLNELTGLDCAE
jgi:hypothetical protein